MKLNKKLFLYFSSIFIVLMFFLSLLQYQRERSFRTEQLDAQLEIYNELIHNYISENGHTITDVYDFIRALPDSTLRITVVALTGEVLFDSSFSDSAVMENHLNRPEIQEAKQKGRGQMVRYSHSVGYDFYYLAQRFTDMYVRTALPYTINLRNTLVSNMFPIYIMGVLLILVIIAVYFIAAKFTKSVQLQEDLMRRRLTQNISHELKTPVASILGYMESILENPNMDAERQHFFIERSYRQACRLTALLQDINTLNKLNESAELYEKNVCDLTEIIRNVLHDVQLQIEQKGCIVVSNFPDTMPIVGNRNLLYSVFRNMTDNTLNYAGEHITLSISLLCDDNKFYYFAFSDNGVGVPNEHLQHLFDRFYRVDKGRSRKLGGTGLGLSIVKNAVMFHQGTISAQNNPDGGLSFTFSLAKE